MTIAITHKFVSAKGDGTDATLVKPSNWNDTHTIQCATSVVLGRQTAGVGNVEELPLTSYMAGLLNTTDFATLAAALGLPTTGDGRLTLKTTADTGWVMMNDGTIGSASSGASTRANADCQALFTLLYNNITDANAPVLTSAGSATTRASQGTASAAWTANCRITLTKQLGRAIIIAGSGSGLTARALGVNGGEETHALTATEIPTITGLNYNNVGFSASGSTSSVATSNGGSTTGGGSFSIVGSIGYSAASVSVSGTIGANNIGFQSNNTGNGAHNNMQPFTAWNIMVKL
ncbi:hypothetical protein CWO91_16545 [Bradyrhizobium genosp. SA-3]|uniref:hypothetical protein n=1 Tax=Bradyrhizobium genosp. SA-3 TaxID=508868 RepID=UPI00102A1ECF|nr:hypothetical protein [Bradyrhizobium genosp. SA-3]RZN09637.1 hypothetical protein CWO91_16545 [Bradyrhizobium genosp. SA-3]